ncbi:hypothetical protein [Candidatus Poriferisodalis sp.]|uniref:hypothetical protein n=1 Tax=Candidatus Poriferisodalis sp. TaxID=3101277 RepID=UPI003B52BF76
MTVVAALLATPNAGAAISDAERAQRPSGLTAEALCGSGGVALSGNSSFAFADIPAVFDCPPPPINTDDNSGDGGGDNSGDGGGDGGGDGEVPVGGSIVKSGEGEPDEAKEEDAKLGDDGLERQNVQQNAVVAFPVRVFDLDSANTGSKGLWGDGTTLWVADEGDKKGYAYELDDPNTDADELGTRDSSVDFGTVHPRGLWSDGDTAWALDYTNDKLVAFDWPARTRKPSRDVTLDSDHTNEAGLWGHNGVLYVLQATTTDPKVYAYQYLNNAHGLTVTGHSEPGSTLTASIGGIVDPDGLADPFTPTLQWQRSSDGGQTWSAIAGETGTEYTLVTADAGALVRVEASFTDNAGYAEVLPSPPRAITAVQPLDYTVYGDLDLFVDSHSDCSDDDQTTEANCDTNDTPQGIWSDGTTVWVGEDGATHMFAYTLATGARDTSKEVSQSQIGRRMSTTTCRSSCAVSRLTGSTCGIPTPPSVCWRTGSMTAPSGLSGRRHSGSKMRSRSASARRTRATRPGCGSTG